MTMLMAVTGASGFVGLNLVQRLLDEGHKVRAIDRACSPHLNRPGVSFVEGNVLDPASMRRALKGVDWVFHLVAKITLAAEDEVAWTLNTKGVRIVAEAALASGVKRMVHCSSIHAFDQYRCGGRIDETSVRSTEPSIPVYDRSKYAGEQELREVIAAGLDAVICNPTGVYGPVDYGLSRINALQRNAALGRIPFVLSGAFDFVDVRDVARGLLLAGERGRTGENYLLGGHHIEALKFFCMGAQTVRRRGPLFALPLGVIKPFVPMAERIGRRMGSDAISEGSIAAIECAPIVSHAKATRELGYTPRAAEESVRDLIAFLVSSNQLVPAAKAAAPSSPEPATAAR
jgi:dihydroflavonol-4-reductase